MKFLADLLPVVIFFVVYKLTDIYIATMSAIVAALLQVGIGWLRTRRLEPMQLLSLGIIFFFGGATILLRDPLFIKWKPTILQWLFAIAFFGSHFFGKKPLVCRMLDAQVAMTPAQWAKLSSAWILFFLFAGALNLYVAYHYDENTWVNFKLFGLMGLTIAFIIIQAFALAPFMREEGKTDPPTPAE